MPVALALVVLGVVMTLVTNPDILAALRFGPSMPQVVVPTGDQWHTGVLAGRETRQPPGCWCPGSATPCYLVL